MFDPNAHMMKLKGKDYLQVMWRLVWFREDKPNWTIDTSILQMDADHAVFKAVVLDENGQQKSAGHGSESKRDFGDFLEKAETKAVGRALAMLGYGTQFAADELDEGERIVDSPVQRTKAIKEEPLPEDAMRPDEHLKPRTWDARKAIQSYCEKRSIKPEEFGAMRRELINEKVVSEIKFDDMQPVDLAALCTAIEARYSVQRAPA